jgi:hypothetical protein
LNTWYTQFTLFSASFDKSLISIGQEETNCARAMTCLVVLKRRQGSFSFGTRLALWEGVRQDKSKNEKKGERTMNTEIITLEVEEMEEAVAPGILVAD